MISQTKVYIVCPNEQQPKAQQLKNALQSYCSDKITIIAIMPEVSLVTSSKLELFDRLQECDFAAIILPCDNLGIPSVSNCVYEAGLFAGAFTSPERCFLLVSNTTNLPSDLLALRLIEPTNMETAGNSIASAIEAFARKDELYPPRRLKNLRTIGVDDLINKEKPEEEGGALRALSANVFVNTPAPYEQKGKEFAKRVICNICKHRIEYRYIFEASDGNKTSIARLLFMLIEDAPISLSLTECLSELKWALEIHFVPDRQGLGLQYCIHNATDPYKAVCYMRIPGAETVEWVEWGRGSEARGVADDITRMCTTDDNGRENGIFRSTVYFGLYDEEPRERKFFREKLWGELVRNFRRYKADFTEKDKRALAEACFGDRSSLIIEPVGEET